LGTKHGTKAPTHEKKPRVQSLAALAFGFDDIYLPNVYIAKI
jgi:hypothetical protein